MLRLTPVSPLCFVDSPISGCRRLTQVGALPHPALILSFHYLVQKYPFWLIKSLLLKKIPRYTDLEIFHLETYFLPRLPYHNPPHLLYLPLQNILWCFTKYSATIHCQFTSPQCQSPLSLLSPKALYFLFYCHHHVPVFRCRHMCLC